MRNCIPSLGLTLTVLALTPACGTDESFDLETEFRTSFGCSGCGYGGSNSPQFNEYPIHTLSYQGGETAEGLLVAGIRSPGGTLHALRAEGDELHAWDGNAIVATGAGLIGWTIVLKDGESELEVHVLDYTNAIVPWATNSGPISAYALAYHDPEVDGYVNVCPDASPAETAVTVLRDVVYDEPSHEVHDDEGGWMTFACFGNAAAKMKQMGYSRHNYLFGSQGYPPSEAQRQATIRMITADYCGEGISFTAQGTDVDWQNALGTVVPVHDPTPSWANVEAIWDEHGALCLGTPRLATLAEVGTHCGLPPCVESMLQYPHEWVTWVVP